jgi:hypothetical protein
MDAQVVVGITSNILTGVGLILLGHLNEPLNHLILSASFGGYASREHEDVLYGTSCILGFILAYTQRNRLDRDQLVSQIRVLWSFSIPLLQLLLQSTFESLGPTNGPLLLSLLSRHILILLGTYNATTFLLLSDYRHSESRPPPSITNSLLPLSLGALLIYPTPLFRPSPLLQKAFTTPFISAIASPPNLQLLHALLQTLLSPPGGRPMTLLTIPILLATILFNPHLSPLRINNHLAPHDWLLLDRAWSTTGYLSVLENRAAGYRVLRCDHSLLGGEWLLTPERQLHENWRVVEPTYAVFEMLEAVRLVTGPRGEEEEGLPPLADADATALVVGMGIGTAPKALIAHGVETTVVEIDAGVRRFAMGWFGLQGNHTSVTADAVEWMAAKDGEGEEEGRKKQYDYIIHDVFTGGASPLALFTAGFLRDLRARLREGSGVIAINYAGDLGLPLTRHVLRTIEHVFDGRRNCRIFRDAAPPTPRSNDGGESEDKTGNHHYSNNGKESKHTDRSRNDDDDGESHEDDDENAGAQRSAQTKKKHQPAKKEEGKEQNDIDHIAQADFTNMVIFCRNTLHPHHSSSPVIPPSWTFRAPVEADYLQTHSRRQYLVPKAEFEIAFPPTDSAAGILEVGDEGAWADQQLESARRHWGLMRKVVPGVVWDWW